MPRVTRPIEKVIERFVRVMAKKGYSRSEAMKIYASLRGATGAAPGSSKGLIVYTGKATSTYAERAANNILALPEGRALALAQKATPAETAIVERVVTQATKKKLSAQAIKEQLTKLLKSGAISKKGVAKALAALVAGGVIAYGTYKLTGDDDDEGEDDFPKIGDEDAEEEAKRLRVKDEVFGQGLDGRVYDRLTRDVRRGFSMPAEDVTYVLDAQDPLWKRQWRQLNLDEILCELVITASKLKSVLGAFREGSKDVYLPIVQDILSFLNDPTDTLCLDSSWLLDQITGASDASTRAAATQFYEKVRGLQSSANASMCTLAINELKSYLDTRESSDDSEDVAFEGVEYIPGNVRAAVHVLSQMSGDSSRMGMAQFLEEQGDADYPTDRLLALVGDVMAEWMDNPTLLGQLINAIMGKKTNY